MLVPQGYIVVALFRGPGISFTVYLLVSLYVFPFVNPVFTLLWKTTPQQQVLHSLSREAETGRGFHNHLIKGDITNNYIKKCMPTVLLPGVTNSKHFFILTLIKYHNRIIETFVKSELSNMFSTSFD